MLLVVPSLLFDLAYGRAMQQKDAREIARKDLQNAIGDEPARIGILHVGPDFYTVMPSVKSLNNEKVTIQLQEPGENADFLLVGFPTEAEPTLINATVRQVETQGKFKYEKSYRVPVRIFGHEFSLTHFPPDMTYSFPTILLFRASST
jgi:hypothetical protein